MPFLHQVVSNSQFLQSRGSYTRTYIVQPPLKASKTEEGKSKLSRAENERTNEKSIQSPARDVEKRERGERLAGWQAGWLGSSCAFK